MECQEGARPVYQGFPFLLGRGHLPLDSSQVGGVVIPVCRGRNQNRFQGGEAARVRVRKLEDPV